jgi:hypothetical protein
VADLEGETFSAATAEEKRYLSLRSQQETPNPDRVQRWLREYRLKRCLGDYKTWGYMVCIGVVVVGGIVLIILAAMGVISTNSDR